MQQVAPHVYVETGYRNANVGCIITEEGVILVDTPMIPAQAIAWRTLVNRASGHAPILYVINTDHHRGHVLGNQFFAAPVIAHELAWKNMRGYGANFCQRVIESYKREPDVQAQFHNIQIVRPTITFDQRLDIEHGGRSVRLIHVGGHTEATIIIWLPEEKILFAGDTVWSDQHPYMAQANSKQWLGALSYIRKLGPEIIVPGHGALCHSRDTEPLSEYIRLVRRRVRTCFRKGYTKQETASSLVKSLVPLFPIPSERRSKIESQIKQGINRVYNEYKKGTEPTRPDADEDDEPMDGEPDEIPAEEEPMSDDIGFDGEDQGSEELDAEFDEDDGEDDDRLDLDDDDPFDQED